MKKRFSILSVLMALTLLLSCFALGCNSDKTGGKGEVEGYQGKGVHQREVKETDTYLIKDGKTDYKILLPEEPVDYEVLAADTINEFVEKSTGAKFPIVYSNEYKTADQGKFISIGTTSIMRKTGMSVAVDKFGQSGYRIKTIGDDIYISGAHAFVREGTFYGALDFLKETISWRCYSIDEIKYDVKNDVKFCEYNFVEIPEFDHRAYSVKQLLASETWQRYLRLNIKEETRIPVSGHSHFEIIPPTEYYALHEDWFYWAGDDNNDGILNSQEGQLCLSNQEMTKEFIKNVVELFREYPDTNFIHIGQQDIMVSCDCDNCKEYSKYIDENGKEQMLNYSGLLCKFTNTVARGVMEEIRKTEPERILYFEMFAYHKSEQPPTIWKGDVQYPMCDEVILDDNVYVQFTPMANYSGSGVPFIHEKNKKVYEFLQGWDLCSSHVSTWTYATNWNNYMFNYPDWDFIAQDLKTFSEMGVNRVYHQNQIHRNMPQMVAMRIFVESELMWNLSLDYDELAKEFIDNYYGEAAPYIWQMYQAMTTYWAYLKSEKGAIGGVYMGFNKADWWSFGYVDSVRRIFDNAFKALESLKTENPADYEKYYWRVADAYTENLFMQMEYYGSEYGEEYAAKAIKFFEDIIARFDYNYMSDGTNRPLTNYIKVWRATYV
ncbi:MAG: DUF4838 domain-containing protein [Clostridia bacterium]|nr:DUF4838 domain-containing protein [Clostridia bacterium]